MEHAEETFVVPALWNREAAGVEGLVGFVGDEQHLQDVAALIGVVRAGLESLFARLELRSVGVHLDLRLFA